MKRFLSLAVLCLIFNCAKAQITTLGITNNRPCDVYIEVYGSNSGCSGTDMAVLTLILPGGGGASTHPIGSLMWPGAVPNYIDYVRVYQADPNICNGASYVEVGESCSGRPAIDWLAYLDVNNSCAACNNDPNQHKVEWVSTLNPLTAVLELQ